MDAKVHKKSNISLKCPSLLWGNFQKSYRRGRAKVDTGGDPTHTPIFGQDGISSPAQHRGKIRKPTFSDTGVAPISAPGGPHHIASFFKMG